MYMSSIYVFSYNVLKIHLIASLQVIYIYIYIYVLYQCVYIYISSIYVFSSNVLKIHLRVRTNTIASIQVMCC